MDVKVLAFGEILWDVIDGVPAIGGAPLNFASHFKQLGGLSSIISAVGRDELGDQALVFMREHSVDTRFTGRSDKATGEVPVVLTEGVPSYTILQNRAWDFIPLTDLILDEIKGCRWDLFYFGTLAQRTSGNRGVLKKILETVTFEEVFLDVNLRQEYYSEDILTDSLEAATILKLNDEEVKVISRLVFKGKFSESDVVGKIMAAFDIPLVIVTLGSKGARLYRSGEVLTLTPPKVKAIDTVGAGDSFSAAFIYSYTKYGDLKKAGELALRVAAHVVTHSGGIKPYPEGLISD